MKTLLPIPDWWYYHVEGQRAPWDVTGAYSDAFLFTLALRCHLNKHTWTGDKYDEIFRVVKQWLPYDEAEEEITALVICINIKWQDIIEFFDSLFPGLGEEETKIPSVQPFSNAILVELPDRFDPKLEVCRIVNVKKLPIDLQ